ncbi:MULTISPECIES: class I SAM-dependent methyltransferase [Oerskovia]|uniref:Malonyl-[acyl-carrier protein] O-methyltransferase n=1 Tax=Oerskovia enterophila TaxID=43678 RepID=A0A161YHZ4_9CELL|nr:MULTISPECIES: class I SAM-dependent methyltransferase [Oerskovia]KZM35778.1 malonyl-[acyl-carrier protein] O-methyltransferase [Oerskovia enterophila]
MSTAAPPEPSSASIPRASHAERASSFGAGAGDYRAVRPSYPDAAIDWMLPAGARHVLDLAAGTGKLTEKLVARGLHVTAVEPSDGMRAQLQDAVPGAHVLPGTAERIPLEDGSVDAVLVAQAWHWFDVATAVPEIARVLRPGGRLGVVWNVRDHTVDWVEQFTEIIHRGDSLEPVHRTPSLDGVDEAFTPLVHATFPWADRLPAAGLRTLAATRSHLLTLPPAERDELLDAVDHLAATHPALAGLTEIDLPYRAECWRADRVLGTDAGMVDE